MSDALLGRIHTDPNVMVGKPVIRGTRLTVDFVIGLLAHGAFVEDMLDEYGGLEREDIQACLQFAQRALPA
ncbi:MAG: DUF433 domain-containing protein [Bacteroidota bacterium]